MCGGEAVTALSSLEEKGSTMTKMRIKVKPAIERGRRIIFTVTCNGPLCGRYREGTFRLSTAFSCAHRHFESHHSAEWLLFANRVRDREDQELRERLDAEADAAFRRDVE